MLQINEVAIKSLEGKTMRHFFVSVPILLATILLSSCFSEEEKAVTKKKDYIIARNGKVEAFKVILQTRLKDHVLVPFGEEVKIEFPPNKSKTVLVKTKSQDPNWNDCSIAMQVGQTLVVYKKYEHIECRAE